MVIPGPVSGSFDDGTCERARAVTTVEIDIEKLGSAITEAEGLADRIDSQRHLASSATPIGLPSLSDGTLGKTARWLRDNLEELQTRRDLAITLDRDDTGHASYEVSSDSLSNVQELLGQELSKSAEDLGHEPSNEEVERFSSVMSRWQNDPDVMGSMYRDLGADGVVGVMANIGTMASFGVLEPDTISGLAERFRSGLSAERREHADVPAPGPLVLRSVPARCGSPARRVRA